ncbi:hypothetical protein BV20DRAFT_981549 [Pilatotrama ljubarskyi]|nr:hypothetical protein BV20DRAFT_981549 [Pilatotrama ljubarskyi]
MSSFRRRLFSLPHNRAPRNIDTTPLPDPLRAESFSGPYYGVEPLESLPLAKALDPEIRTKLQERARRHEQELRGLYAVLNAGCRINRLPVELLVEIFAHVQGAERAQNWLHILTVCRYWFVVVSTAPILWKNLKVQGTTNLLRTGLRRSKQAEINVEVSALCSVPFHDVLDILAPHAHRLRSLTLSGISQTGIAAVSLFLESYTFPALRYFEAHLDRRIMDMFDLAVSFPAERFPKVQEFDISRINIFASTSAFVQLRKLRVESCRGKNPELSTCMLVDAICALRNIEELELFETHVLDAGTAVISPREEKVTLSKLRRATFLTEAAVIKAILSGVIMPASANVSFAAPLMAEAPEGDAESLRDLLPEDRTCLPILSHIVTAHIVSSADRHTIHGKAAAAAASPSSSSSLQLSLDQYTMGLVDDAGWEAIGLGDFTDILRNAPLQTVTIECTRDCFHQADWPAIISDHPKLLHLKVTVFYDGEPDPILAELLFEGLNPAFVGTIAGVRVDGDSAEHDVPCPALESVSLAGFSAPSDAQVQTIVAHLESRRKALGESAKQVLDTLSIQCIGHRDPEHYDERRAVVENALRNKNLAGFSVLTRSRDSGPEQSDSLADPGVLQVADWQYPFYGVPPLEGASCATPPAAQFRTPFLKKRKLEHELASVGALLNAGVPINTLPNELLVEIISLVQWYEPEGRGFFWPIVLRVCRRWFAVAASTLALWRLLWADTSMNHLRTCLVRSRNMTITVSTGRQALVPQVLELILPHLPRVREIRLSCVMPDDVPLYSWVPYISQWPHS